MWGEFVLDRRSCVLPCIIYCISFCSILAGTCWTAKVLESQWQVHVFWPRATIIFSLAAEGLGLILLRWRISVHGHVSGISGHTLCIYLSTYAARACNPVVFEWNYVILLVLYLIEISLMLQLLDITWCVFFTYRSSYDSDLDSLPTIRVLFGFMLLALVSPLYEPSGRPVPIARIFFMYVDVYSLLPQLAMMSQQMSGSPSPIAHYIAAVGFSKLVDLKYWLDFLHVFSAFGKVSMSGWVALGCSIMDLLMVSDFFYYYFKSILRNMRNPKDNSLNCSV